MCVSPTRAASYQRLASLLVRQRVCVVKSRVSLSAGLSTRTMLIYAPTGCLVVASLLSFSSRRSITSAVQSLTFGFVMPPLVAITFYCVFEPSEQDYISAI